MAASFRPSLLLRPSAAAAAALLLAGPSLAHAQSLQVDVANGNSPYNVSGATYFNSVIVGLSTTGVLNHTAGTFRDDNNVTLGNSAGSSGSYNLSGTGALTARNGIIGQFGSGTFTQSGGTITLSLDLLLGAQTGGSGSYNLSGTGALSASEDSSVYTAAAPSPRAAGPTRSAVHFISATASASTAATP